MKIKLFTIPNILTLANLLCGVLAICEILLSGGYSRAFMLIILAGVFDFLDGFTARLLKQSSEIGLQLDSLADMVSFGVVPALIMMSMFIDVEKSISHPLWLAYGCYVPLVIALFSALRLAKFNIDSEQTSSFVGLPTPACALFCGALGMLYSEGFVVCGEWIAVISVVIALLLISPLKMFALKFKSFKWGGNELRYIFIIASSALFLWLQLNSVSLIILLYIALSGVVHIAEVVRR